ncbi:MAG: MerR family transcriptional regulator [Propionibacteriaceae bacterium]|jgi:DNA-binding transcriptional MerR regulator|nr:MerR family transcriptional regulator [Propionibacteriaceae bacterium]
MAIGLRSIGQVKAILEAEFPDISISKIRFLESEGLISPERAPSGYRRYGESDIERLRFILNAQKKHYLPLNVIREQLDALDRGEPAATEDAVEASPASTGATAPIEPSLPRKQALPQRAMRISRRDLINAAGITEAAFADLEKQGLIKPRRGTIYYDRDALTVAIIARKLATYGIAPRHLRTVKQAAASEAGLIEAAVTPFLRRNPTARGLSTEVMQMVMYAHAAMMRSILS